MPPNPYFWYLNKSLPADKKEAIFPSVAMQVGEALLRSPRFYSWALSTFLLPWVSSMSRISGFTTEFDIKSALFWGPDCLFYKTAYLQMSEVFPNFSLLVLVFQKCDWGNCTGGKRFKLTSAKSISAPSAVDSCLFIQ